MKLNKAKSKNKKKGNYEFFYLLDEAPKMHQLKVTSKNLNYKGKEPKNMKPIPSKESIQYLPLYKKLFLKVNW